MKLYIWMIILIISLFQTIIAYVDKQSHIVQAFQSNLTQFMTAQNQIGNDPVRHFLCGFAFRQMKWVKSLPTCNCQTKATNNNIASIKCEWCDNTFYSMRNGFKAIFCSINNWSNQIIKTFETGNKDSRNWLTYKCPKNTFVNQVAARTACQQQTNIGLVGMQMKCSSLNLSSSYIVKDKNAYQISELSENSQSTFVSAVEIKYLSNLMLTGIRIIFEGIGVIQSVQIKYFKQEIINKNEKIIQNKTIVNKQLSTMRSKISLTKQYSKMDFYNNNQKHLNDYQFTKKSTIILPQQNANSAQQTYPYKIITQIFKFGQNISTKMIPNSPIMITVPQMTNTTVYTTIEQKQVKKDYEATIRFVDNITGQLIRQKTVNGVRIGKQISGYKLNFQQNQCVGTWSNNNLIINGNFRNNTCDKQWCLWIEKDYKPSFLPGWYPNPQIQLSKGQNYNPVLNNTIVVELDVYNNSFIKQLIELKKGKYLITFDWAARINFKFDSNLIQVRVNNKTIKSINPFDYNLHTQNIEFMLNQYIPISSFQLCGGGINDGVGAVVTNIKIFSYNECINVNSVKY